MTNDDLQEKYFHFDCVIRRLLTQYTVEWEIPYDIKTLPNDLPKLKSLNRSVEFWLYPHANLKTKQISRINEGKIYGLTLLRSICPPLNLDLEFFKECLTANGA